MFVILKPFEERAGKAGMSGPAVAARPAQQVRVVPRGAGGPVRRPAGGRPGQDGRLQAPGAGSPRRRADERCRAACKTWRTQGNRDPKLVGLFSSFSVTQPQLFIEIDEEKAKAQQIKLKEIDETLQASLGSFYVNDFFFQNRNWQVNIQAGPALPHQDGRHRQPRSAQRQGRPRAAMQP